MAYGTAVALSLTFWGWTPARAHDFVDEDGINDVETFKHRAGKRGRRGIARLLTEEQRTALKETVDALKAEGATDEEIRAAVDALFEEFGIERPGGFLRSLTDEQRAAVKEKVSSLRVEGATDEEIQAAVNTLFEELGVEPPEGWQFRSRRSGGLLSDEQRTAVKERIDALKAEGATDEEIRAAVGVLFEEFGIERPARGRFGGKLGGSLTEEQRTSLREKVDALKAEGATDEEIRAAVREELAEYGIERPEGKHRRGRGRGGRGPAVDNAGNGDSEELAKPASPPKGEEEAGGKSEQGGGRGLLPFPFHYIKNKYRFHRRLKLIEM